MPSYDFVCETCNAEKEEFHSIKNIVKPICCGKEMTIKISRSNFILKGDGWAGQDIKRANEDDGLRDISRRARELKESGRVAGDEILTTQDVERMNP